ncbi:MAG: hypothetical protein AAF657_07390 [Acidobacteriota bacterium]
MHAISKRIRPASTRWLSPCRQLCCWSIVACLAAPAVATDLVILSVRAVAETGSKVNDVEVQLAIRQSASLPVPTYLDMVSPANQVIASGVVLGMAGHGGPPSFRVVLDNALSDTILQTHGWSYRLVIRGDDDLAEPLWFHVGGCTDAYEILQGLETNGVVISQALNQALNGHVGDLPSLAVQYPSLACEIDQLAARLGPAGGAGNECWLQVVVVGDISSYSIDQALGGVETKGLEAGSNHCFSAIAEDNPIGTYKALGPCDPDSFSPVKTRLKTRYRCRDSAGTFGVASCQGALELEATLQAIVAANLHGNTAAAYSCAYERVALSLGGVEVASLQARADDDPVLDLSDGEHKEVTGSVAVTAGADFNIIIETLGGAEMMAPVNNRTFAEYGNYFAIQGTASATCAPSYKVSLTSLDFLTARDPDFIVSTLRGLDNGIKDPDW